MTAIPTHKVHDLAKAGFGKGTNELYDKARPSYPPEALEVIHKALGSKESINVVEIGAGTGIFTRCFLSHPSFQSSVSAIKAIEPSEGMRSVFSKTVTDPRASVAEGTFDNATGVEDGWADLIVIAQAFHWCPDHEAAIKEFARVLKPDGIVVFIWNLEDRERARWVATLRDSYETYEQNSPQYRLGLWRAVFSVPSYAANFNPHEETIVSHSIPATEQSVQDRVCSKSYIAIQPPDVQKQVRERIREIVEKGEEKVWIDKEKGVFEYPYKTAVVVLRRKQSQVPWTTLRIEIAVNFSRSRPKCRLQIKLKDEMKTRYESKVFRELEALQWNCDVYVKSPSIAIMTIQSSVNALRRDCIAKVQLDFGSADFCDNNTVERTNLSHGFTVRLTVGVSGNNIDVARLLANKAVSALAIKISMLEKMDKVLGYLDVFLSFGSAVSEAHPYAKAASVGLNAAFKRFQEIPTCHREFVNIMDDVVLLLPLLELLQRRIENEAVKNILSNFIDIIKRLSRDLYRYSSKPLFGFLLHNWYKSKLNEVKAFNDRLNRLCSTLNIAISNEIHQYQLSEEDEKVLRQLKPPEKSSFDLKRCCLQGTRKAVLRTIDDWIRLTDRCEQLYWIHGVAGCGKSSVAASISAVLDSRKTLSGSFFCSRDIPERRSSTRLVHSLVYFLARASPPSKDALLRLLKEDPELVDRPLLTQFKALLSCFRLTMSDSTQSRPIILVIDALDECEDNEDASSFIVKILQLVPHLKIILTSRPLPRIQEALTAFETLRSCDLFKVDSYADILHYAREEFSKSNTRLPRKFPDDQIVALAQKASGHFIWIATVLKHISILPWRKEDTLTQIICSTRSNSPGEEKLDAIYQRVLDDACEDSQERMDAIRLLIGLIFATSRNRPLPAKALHTFVTIDIRFDEFQRLLQELGSVLTEESETGAIRACHPSFLDFVESPRRARHYGIEMAILDKDMAKKCLDIMVSELKFNICNLETSHLPNSDVRDLAGRIQNYIPQELQYSCLYWLEHMSRSPAEAVYDSSIEQKLLRVFCQATSLYWLEALSLLSKLNAAVSILRDLPYLPEYSNMDQGLRKSTEDLFRFVMTYYEPMAVSAPHIYISALLWAPAESVTAKLHCEDFASAQLVDEGLERYWPITLRTIPVGSDVTSIAYSPDGRHIVSGCADRTIRIWDAETGTSVSEPLRGHEGWIQCIAYSPDGRCIMSGSGNGTICIWDARTGVRVGRPLRGHEDYVVSVAYSPDGRYIVSGSTDKTIRIWDVETGVPIGEPLRGHESYDQCLTYSLDGRRIIYGAHDMSISVWDAQTGVRISEFLQESEDRVCSIACSPDGRRMAFGMSNGTICIRDTETGAPVGELLQGNDWHNRSLAYSPDGCRIISGSDSTICIWDTKTGAPVSEQLPAHEKGTWCLVYSPDGRRFISASKDQTICVWDAQTGVRAGEPTRGQIQKVYCGAYSPDGRHIAFGTFDKTVCIWDVATGAPVGEPLHGHEAPITSVGYSPDGRHIVSGSYDNTLRIWDAEMGIAVGEPLRGHEHFVYAVAYSPDGRRIVSSSHDRTIRIWDAETGAPICEPARGHTSNVWSVAYSPDGCRIVSGSDDKTIRLWDAETGISVGEPLRGHEGGIQCVAYAPDGFHIVSGSYDSTIRIWDAKIGAPIGELFRGQKDQVYSVGYSPDGHCIVSGFFKIIRIWDAETGDPIGEPLRGHEWTVLSVAYSPDGSRIISGSADRTIRVWDANCHILLGKMHESRRRWIGFRQDGTFTLSSSDTNDTLQRLPPCIPTDGWIRDSDGGLVLWVPFEYQNGICDMSLFTIPRNARGHPVRIDWSRLSHGTAWTSVKNKD
ncbi:WD40 repeat-like protein [Fomitiporia mediterranea MF3/22]|uniref:WD40 repeat-like protein n=1 Tax=Fomitiporia mediterranea (strain MF3/22) TaxID=694068 RepID=UPI0004409C32|nr:WD40 repeat-like protein [Fomitiporia mediterranea MF3/22]EJD02306.1 WD40 repeat-like protein [Fomitiporia mediterranea MF3/22]